MEHATADPASSSAAAAPPPPHYYTPCPDQPPHPQPQSLTPHYYNPSQSHYASNPNPSPNPIYNTPPSYAPSYTPSAVASYTPDPYAAHGGYEGLYASCQAPSASYYQEGHADYVDQQEHLEMNPIGGGVFKRKNVEMRRAYENLDTKRHKLIKAGASVDSVKVCKVCNVVCNGDTVLAAHLAGGKHALKVTQAAGRSSKGRTPVFPVGIKPTIATTFVGAVPKKPAISSFYCEVCKIECNKQDILNMHKEGKKHKRNLKRLQELITEKPLNIVANAGSNTVADDEQKKLQQLITEKPLNIVTNAGNNTAVDEQPKRKAAQVTVDLEVKRKKVLDAGVAAEEIRTCILCNVMCNSQSVFDSHMVGRKHASMVKNKQQQQLT